jgi:energy-converting hydrogenase Eha subunit A
MPSTASQSGIPDSSDSGLARRYEAVQQMVVDYAIGLAILGLFHAFLTPVLVVAVLLLFKMVWDIARRWSFAVTLNPIPLLGQVLNVLGASAIALLAWITLVSLGAFVPLIDHYALAAALMSGTWTLGASANQFFMNAFLHRGLRRTGEVRHV